jgi:transposase
MNRPGCKPRNNRTILSGVMHVIKVGCRWQDCPPEYWSARGIWQRIFETVADPAEPPEEAALDSTHVKAHRCAGGGKGGPLNKRSASPGAVATARFTPLPISIAARG